MRERILYVGKENAMGRDILIALEKLGHECIFFDQRAGVSYSEIARRLMRTVTPLSFLRRYDDRRMNNRLLATARQFKPTILFVWNGDSISPDTVRTIAADGAITVNWFLDLMTHWTTIAHVSPAYDHFFTPDRRVIRALKEIGIAAGHAPFAYASTFASFPDGPRQYPVAFVGSYHPDVWRKREEFLSSVSEFGVHIWGPPPWRTSRLRDQYHGEARGKVMMDIYRQSRIVVDVPWDHMAADAVSIRPYEATAAGACLFYYDIRPEMPELFVPEQEYVAFRTVDELREKASHYLHHPGALEKIARAGYARFMRDHTYEARLRIIISEIRAAA